MKKLYFASAFVFIFAIAGCSKVVENEVTETDDMICGSVEFISSVKSLELTPTKTGELSEEELMAQIAPLFPISIDYLRKNGYDYKEDFEDGDPAIILTALALYDYDRTNEILTKGEVLHVLSCVVFGADAGALAGLGAKYIAKKLAKEAAKAALKRLVPGVGVAVGVISAVICLADL